MTWLPDAVLDHLRDVADRPDLGDTKYEILEPIGRGGMGTVYRARDRELDREVAIKVVSVPEAPSYAIARMLREARTIARLEHPGIVPVHDVGTLPDGRVFYVMKLVRGARLDEHVRGSLSIAELLRAFERVCEAVGFAHACGVIHRDLKPQNVMVGAFGEVLVMDWGVAKLGDDRARDPHEAERQPGAVSLADAADTADGTVLGTPGYMAPEQACGEIERIDARTDVYALGAMLHFLLAGRVPAHAVATGHGGRTPSDTVAEPRRGIAGVPRRLEAIVLKAMRPAPDERYQSVDALSADVSAFLAGFPVSAYREGPLERAWRVAVTYRVPILLVIAYLLMRLLLLAFTGR